METGWQIFAWTVERATAERNTMPQELVEICFDKFHGILYKGTEMRITSITIKRPPKRLLLPPVYNEASSTPPAASHQADASIPARRSHLIPPPGPFGTLLRHTPLHVHDTTVDPAIGHGRALLQWW